MPRKKSPDSIPKKRGPKPREKIPLPLTPLLKESRPVQTLRAGPVFKSLYALQDLINSYFEQYSVNQEVVPSPAGLARFLNFSSVKELKDFKGNKGVKSEISYIRLISKALLRVEEVLCHLVASRQNYGGAIFILKSQCGYSEKDILQIETVDIPKISSDQKADLKAAARLMAERKRARLNDKPGSVSGSSESVH